MVVVGDVMVALMGFRFDDDDRIVNFYVAYLSVISSVWIVTKRGDFGELYDKNFFVIF